MEQALLMNFETRLNAIETSFGNFSASLGDDLDAEKNGGNSLEQQLTGFEQRVAGLEKAMRSLSSSLSELNPRLKSAESLFVQLQEKLCRQKAESEVTKAAFDSMACQIRTLSSEVYELRNVLDSLNA
jgi:chromosome segregation ATPase